jgi:transcriptional regulator NrdR family protein
MISAANHKLVPFSRDQLFISLYRSCGHRKTAIQDAAALSNTITARLLKQPTTSQGVFSKADIRKAALLSLQHFDLAAATYYQAYYAE